MGRRRCCCEGVCWSWTDGFTRADSTGLGSDWDERSGDWSIGTNALVEAGASGALVVMANSVSPTPFHHNVTIMVADDLDVGSKPRIVVNYVDDSNYFFAEFEKTAANNVGDLRLYQKSGGSDSLLAELIGTALEPVGGWAPFRVCFNDELFAATVTGDWGPNTDQPVYVCNPGRNASGNKAGVGNGASYELRVASFTVQEIWPTKEDCPECVCTCEGECLPHSLTATITLDDPAGGCQYAGLDGQTFPLIMAQGADEWQSAEITICGHPISWTFGCTEDLDPLPADSTPKFTLRYLTLPDPAICVSLASERGDASHVCDPLSIVFGPYSIVTGGTPLECMCCGEGESNSLWITITE